MGIDITKLEDEQLLAALGTGDWLISLPNNYPDLLVSRAWRDEIEKLIALDFVRWVIAGIDIEINHGLDPNWDSSGHPRSHQTDSLLLLIRYERLSDWLENAYTGTSTASYVSGMGIFWDTYAERLNEEIAERVYPLLKAHIRPLQTHIEEIDEDAWDEGYEEVDLIDICLRPTLYLWIKRLSTKEVWAKYENLVRADLAQEAQAAAQNQQVRATIKAFWDAHFSDLGHTKIEMPEYEQKGLEQRLRDLFADSDPKLLEAINKFGLPFYCSNSVSLAITQLVQTALKD